MPVSLHKHTLTAICETVTKWIYWLVFMIFLLVCAMIATQSERCLRYNELSISSFFWRKKKDFCAYLVFWKNRVHSRRQKVLAVARVTHYSLMFESHRGPVVFMFFMLCIENQTKWFSFIFWLCLRFVLASKQIHLEQFYWNREDYRADWVCREKHWHSTVALE